MDVTGLSDAELAAYRAGDGPDILQAGYSYDQQERDDRQSRLPLRHAGP
jgi:hypothetical protein